MFGGEPNPSSPSWVSAMPRFATEHRSPLKALKSLFSPSDEIDWLLCPGDLADRHNEVCQGVAWTALVDLKQSLHIRHLFATVGNHDVDSRHVDERQSLPTTAIRSLEPSFPHANATNENFANEFWANGFASHTEQNRDISLVVLNSSQFHGIDSGHIVDGQLVDQEWNRGRVSQEALARLRRFAIHTTTSRNILMLHHHVQPTDALGQDLSVLLESNEMLDYLANSQQDWVVLHGHLHIPMLYPSARGGEVTILSSGSAGGKTWTGNTGSTPNNQVHLLEFTDQPGIKASVLSWNWVNNVGWQPASSSEHGLPKITGFGASISTVQAVQEVGRLLEAEDEVEWTTVVERVPDLQFLKPSEFARLLDELENQGHELRYERGTEVPLVIRRV